MLMGSVKTSAELFAFDTETTSLRYMNAEIVGVSFAIEPSEAAYVPLGHDYMGAPEQLDRDEVLNQLKPLLLRLPFRRWGECIFPPPQIPRRSISE